MAMNSESMRYWRDYFKTSSYDVLDIMENAVLIAASDFPQELKLRRDRIVELLFSSTLSSCSGCHHLQLTVPDNDDDNGGCKSGLLKVANESKLEATKESNINHDHEKLEGVNNVSNGEAEPLTDIEEVLRIKKILLNSKEESDLVLDESLRKLQLMSMTVDILKSTEIGKVVSSLRKHGSQAICGLARTLYITWKKMAEEWIKTNKAMIDSEGIADSVNPSSLDEEEGLPCPPLDEAFLATQTGSIDIVKIFDGMNDSGNPQKSGKIVKSHENERKRSSTKPTEKPITAANQEKLRNSGLGRGKPPRIVIAQSQTSNVETKQKGDNNELQKSPAHANQDKLNQFDEGAVQMKLESTKRKLQERYQQIDNAKRQRTIKVMDLKDLPNLGTGQRKTHMKPPTCNRK